jgi:hypothetical protein
MEGVPRLPSCDFISNVFRQGIIPNEAIIGTPHRLHNNKLCVSRVLTADKRCTGIFQVAILGWQYSAEISSI